MASYTHREVVTRRIEHIVPSGDPIAEFERALAKLLDAYRAEHGMAPDEQPSWGDWARVHARDDEVVIAFTVETPEVDRG